MVKKTKTMVLDTETATVVKKVTCCNYGDPAGYEMTMYLSPEGNYFLYTFGGADSPYKKEEIKSCTKSQAMKWLSEN